MPATGNRKYPKSYRKLFTTKNSDVGTLVGEETNPTSWILLTEYFSSEGGLYVGAAGVGYMLWYLQHKIPGQFTLKIQNSRHLVFDIPSPVSNKILYLYIWSFAQTAKADISRLTGWLSEIFSQFEIFSYRREARRAAGGCSEIDEGPAVLL